VNVENVHVNLFFAAHDFRTITFDYPWSLAKAGVSSLSTSTCTPGNEDIG